MIIIHYLHDYLSSLIMLHHKNFNLHQIFNEVFTCCIQVGNNDMFLFLHFHRNKDSEDNGEFSG